MSKKTHFITRHWRSLALVSILLIAVLLISTLTVAQPNSPEAMLREAMQRAQQAGSYQVSIDLVQTVYGTPDQPPAAGFPAQQGVHLTIDGSIGGADHARLSVKPAETGQRLPTANAAPQDFIVAGNELYQSVGDRWEKLPDAAPIPGLNTDSLSLLNVAQDFQALEPIEREAGHFQRVAFTLPAHEVTRYMLQQQGQLTDQNLALAEAGGAGFGGTGELVDRHSRLSRAPGAESRIESAGRGRLSHVCHQHSRLLAIRRAIPRRNVRSDDLAIDEGCAIAPSGSGLTQEQVIQSGALVIAFPIGLLLPRG
jgi:hypothetical protein